jgi:hypothetical protein
VAASFSLGAHLVKNNLFGISLENIMLVFGCIMIGSQAAGIIKFLRLLVTIGQVKLFAKKYNKKIRPSS